MTASMKLTLNITEALVLALIRERSQGQPFLPESLHAYLPNYVSRTAMGRYCRSLYDKGHLVRLERTGVKDRIYYQLPESAEFRGMFG